MTETNELQLSPKWLTVRLSPKDYAKLTGHSEHFVRNYCMTGEFKDDPKAQIELRFPMIEILANCDKVTTIGSEERGNQL